MSSSLVTYSGPANPTEVKELAVAKGAYPYLEAMIDLARQAFPNSTLRVSLGQDAEDEAHRYIALDAEVCGPTTEELLAGQKIWSAGVPGVCPSRYAVYFVLGWQ